MVIRIILYFILGLIGIRVFSKQIKKHIFLLIIIAALAAFIMIAAPAMNDLNNITNNAELVGTYDCIGSVYYDQNDNMYFVISVNPWNVLESYKKVAIDTNVGEIIHIASHITDDIEDFIENYK